MTDWLTYFGTIGPWLYVYKRDRSQPSHEDLLLVPRGYLIFFDFLLGYYPLCSTNSPWLYTYCAYICTIYRAVPVTTSLVLNWVLCKAVFEEKIEKRRGGLYQVKGSWQDVPIELQ